MIVTEVTDPTAIVLTEKLAVMVPSGTVTLAATVAAALSLDNVTTAPPGAAGLFKVTVPVEEAPPVTLAGLTTTLESTGALIVNVAVFEAL